MNRWVKRSIQIANSPGYLDELYEVYPVVQEAERKIAPDVKRELEEIYKARDNLTLIKRLLDLPKFPVNDPYVAFLRKDEIFLKYNPRTVNRIADRIRGMGFAAMMEAIEEPKMASRQISKLFKKWLFKTGYPFLPETEFETDKGIAFLKGSNGRLRDFANRKLGCGLEKNPDFLAKVGQNYIIGEAKFLSDYGGAQNANFEDALRLLRGKKGKAIRIAVLDGVVWIKDSTKMYRTVCELEDVALTALLLKDFLKRVGEK